MVAAGMVPCGDYVLVALATTAQDRTPSGLYIPESARGDEKIRRGMVKAVSPHVVKSKFGIRVGDTVLISQFARKEDVGGGCVLVHAESIMGATS